MHFTKSKIAVAVATTSVFALAGTAAFAYFTTSGSGGGSASVGAATAWAVSVNPVSGGPLFPGVGTETFTYSVTNSGTAPQTLNSVVATIDSNTDGDVGATGCKSAWFNVSIAGDPAGSVAPGASNNGTGTITMVDSGTNQDACENASPTFTLVAS